MALSKFAPVYASFGGGVLSPTMWGREDLGKFKTGLARADNCLIKLAGPVVNRSGFTFLGEVPLTEGQIALGYGDDVRMFPYQDTYGNSYAVVSTGAGEMFLLKDGELVRHNTYAIPNSYGEIMDNGYLFSEESLFSFGTAPLVDYVLTQDKMYFVWKDLFPKVLNKVGSGDHDWLVESLSVAPALSAPANTVAVLSYTPGTSKRTYKYKVGATTIPEDGPRESFPSPEVAIEANRVWNADELIYLYWNAITDSSMYKWTLSGSGTGEYYLELLAGGAALSEEVQTVFEDKTEMTEGTLGSLAVGEWAWGDNDSLGFSTIYVRIAGSVDPDTKATEYLTFIGAGEYEYNVYKDSVGFFGRIITTDVPFATDDNITPETDSTPKQDRNPLTGAGYYPQAVSIYQQRLGFGGASFTPQQIEWSSSGAFEDFTTGSPPAPNDSFASPLYSDRFAEIYYMVSLRRCLVFTAAGLFVLGSTSDSEGLSFTTQRFDVQDADSVSKVKPIVIKDTVLYVDGSGRRVFDSFFQLENDGFSGQGLTIMSEHLFQGRTIKKLVYYKGNYDELVLALCEDGALIPMTYNRFHQMWAWSGPLFTEGKFIDVCSVPTKEGGDLLFAVILRNGRYCLEQWEERNMDLPLEWSSFVDSGARLQDEYGWDGGHEILEVDGTTLRIDTSHYDTPPTPTGVRIVVQGLEDETFNSPYTNTWVLDSAPDADGYFTLDDVDSVIPATADNLSPLVRAKAYFRYGNTTTKMYGVNHLSGYTDKLSVLADGAYVESPDYNDFTEYSVSQFGLYTLGIWMITNEAFPEGTFEVGDRVVFSGDQAVTTYLWFGQRVYYVTGVDTATKSVWVKPLGIDYDEIIAWFSGTKYPTSLNIKKEPYIEFQGDVSTAVAGIAYTSTVETLPMASSTGNGAVGNLQKKIMTDDFRFYKTRGVEVGLVGEAGYEMVERKGVLGAGEPLLSSGLTSAHIPGTFTKESRIRIRQEYPLPFALQAHIPVVKVGGVVGNA